jgi:hypothetical protein
LSPSTYWYLTYKDATEYVIWLHHGAEVVRDPANDWRYKYSRRRLTQVRRSLGPQVLLPPTAYAGTAASNTVNTQASATARLLLGMELPPCMAIETWPFLGAPTSDAAKTLGIKELASEALLKTLEKHLRDRQMLVVLDNFEHLPTAASAVGELVGRCQQLTVLVTSRAPLYLRRERQFPVPTLPVVDMPSQADSLGQHQPWSCFVSGLKPSRLPSSLRTRTRPL